MKLKHSILALAIAGAFASTSQAQTQALNYEAKETSTVLTAGGVPVAWSRGFTGKGSIIAIVDQGFDLTHKDFAGKILGFKNFYVGDSLPWGYHGTLMAGIAAGAKNADALNPNGIGTVGVAYDAKLLLAQVGPGGNGTGVSFSAIKNSIDWASANGATVINLSLGSNFDTNFIKGVTQLSSGTPGIYKTAPGYNSIYGFSQSDVQAFAVGTNRGSIIVAAAGNGGAATNGAGLPYSQFPGAFATQVDSTGKLVLGGRMIIVGASDATGTVLAPFSNKAGSICNNIVGTVCNDPYLVKDFYVVAPGMQVYGSTANNLNMGKDGSTAVTGTSPATAYVSGGIALMKQAWPQLRPEQLVALVLNTARPMSGCSSDVCGHGMVDFDAATRPMGAVVLANKEILNGSGPQGKTVSLAGTGVVSGGSASFGTSSVLQNTQVVDTIGRNYTVNLAQAQNSVNLMSYQYGSPWMAMAGANYKQFITPVGKDSLLTIMSSDTGAATQYEWKQSDNTRLSLEMGTLNERNGFLGTQGGGAMAFGGSSTTWAGAGINYRFAEKTSVIGNYTMGITRTSNVTDSMVQLDRAIISDAWKLGIAQERTFIDMGKLKDTITLAVAQPVQVRSGYATVSGVTGYTYTDNNDGTSAANPITSHERVNLAPGVREMDLVLGYTISRSNTASVGISYVRQFNAGGQAGLQSNGVALMARSVF